jgi:DNA polymerase III subunit alpha
MLARGGTSGVFQFESALATEKLRAMKADRFDDLIATNALIRPGPLDMGMDQVYIRRKLGQEQVRYQFTGARGSPGADLRRDRLPGAGDAYRADPLRLLARRSGRAPEGGGQEGRGADQEGAGRFVEKAVERGHDRGLIQDLADQIEAFGRYGFNKSHSAAYGLLSYQTAWLKAHYPAEFMAALLSSVVDKAEDVVAYIADCRELGKFLPEKCPKGLEVLPPHVNESNLKFTVVGEGVGSIRFGLGAIRGVGEGAVRSILAAREAEGRSARCSTCSPASTCGSATSGCWRR